MKKETTKCSTRGFLHNCQPPAWQKNLGGIERLERGGRSARPRIREYRGEERENATDGEAKEERSSAVFTFQAMVSRRTIRVS